MSRFKSTIRSKRTVLLALAVVGAFWALCLVSSLSSAQITFERAIEGSFDDYGFSVQQTEDGGYIITGETESFGAAWLDLCLIRTDSVGDTLWVGTYGGAGWERGNSVLQVSDGSYIVTGWYDFGGGRGIDVWLIKTDSLGDTAWTKAYAGSNDELGNSVQQTDDGGYITVGVVGSEMYLLKTDSVGDSIWTRVYGGSGADEGKSVRQASDGGYVIAGWTDSFGAGAEDVYLVRTDSVGDTLWTRTYGGSGSDRGYSVQQISDGGCIIVGWTESFGAGTLDVWLIRTDSLGDTLWTRTYGGTDSDYGLSVQQTQDRGYIIAGYTWSFGAGRYDVYLVKTDSLGDALWERTYGGSWSDCGYSVQQTSDGGYIIVGSTVLGVGGDDFYLIKTDENGIVNRDVGVVSIDAPLPDTVYTDSTYPVMATVHNYRPTFVYCWVKATVGSYSDSVHIGSLRPDSSLQITFADWQVPPDDSTAYILTICTHQTDDVDTTNNCASKSIFAYSPVGIEERTERQSRIVAFGLGQCEPNPFQRSTLISYSLAVPAQVTLEVYDITGRLVEILVNETQDPGIHQVRWDRKNNASSVYFYRLKAGQFEETRKMVVVE